MSEFGHEDTPLQPLSKSDCQILHDRIDAQDIELLEQGARFEQHQRDRVAEIQRFNDQQLQPLYTYVRVSRTLSIVAATAAVTGVVVALVVLGVVLWLHAR